MSNIEKLISSVTVCPFCYEENKRNVNKRTRINEYKERLCYVCSKCRRHMLVEEEKDDNQ